MRQARQVCLDDDFPPLGICRDPLTEGKQHPPLIFNGLAVQEGPHVPHLLDDLGSNGIWIQRTPRHSKDLLLTGGQHEQLVVDGPELLCHGRITAVQQPVGDTVHDPPLLLLGGLDVLVDLAGVQNIAPD